MDIRFGTHTLLAQARTAVLLILPLAAVWDANAAPVLPSGNFQCMGSGEVACTGGAAAIPTNPGQIQGVKQWIDGQALALTGERLIGAVTFSTSGNLNESIAAGAVIPISFEFLIQGEDGAPVTDWYIYLALLRSGSNAGSVTIGGPTGGWQHGQLNLVTTMALNAGDSLMLETTIGGAVEGGTLIVQVPQNSVDWNSSSVPEPASFSLLAAGAVILGAVRARKG